MIALIHWNWNQMVSLEFKNNFWDFIMVFAKGYQQLLFYKVCSTNLSELYQSRLDLFQQKSQTVSQHRWNCKRPTQKRFALIMNHSWVQRCKLFWFQIILSHKLWLTNDRQVKNHPWPQLPILNFANCWNQKMKNNLFAPDDFEGSERGLSHPTWTVQERLVSEEPYPLVSGKNGIGILFKYFERKTNFLKTACIKQLYVVKFA